MLYMLFNQRRQTKDMGRSSDQRRLAADRSRSVPSLALRRRRPRKPSRTSTRAARSRSSYLPTWAAASTPIRARSPDTSPATFRARRTSWCRTCRGPAASLRSTTSPISRRATARVFSDADSTMPFYKLLEGTNSRFDPFTLNWIGSISRQIGVCIAWHASSFKTLDDAMARPMRLSGTATGGLALHVAASLQHRRRLEVRGHHGLLGAAGLPCDGAWRGRRGLRYLRHAAGDASRIGSHRTN